MRKGRTTLNIGPPGSGKTAVGEDLARRLGLPCYKKSQHGMVDEKDLFGEWRQGADGQYYLTSDYEYIDVATGEPLQLSKTAREDLDGLSWQELKDRGIRKTFKSLFLDYWFNGGVVIFDEGAVGKRGKMLLEMLTAIARGDDTLYLNMVPGQKGMPLPRNPYFLMVIPCNLGREELAEDFLAHVDIYHMDSNYTDRELEQILMPIYEDAIESGIPQETCVSLVQRQIRVHRSILALVKQTKDQLSQEDLYQCGLRELLAAAQDMVKHLRMYPKESEVAFVDKIHSAYYKLLETVRERRGVLRMIKRHFLPVGELQDASLVGQIELMMHTLQQKPDLYNDALPELLVQKYLQHTSLDDVVEVLRQVKELPDSRLRIKLLLDLVSVAHEHYGPQDVTAFLGMLGKEVRQVLAQLNGRINSSSYEVAEEDFRFASTIMRTLQFLQGKQAAIPIEVLKDSIDLLLSIPRNWTCEYQETIVAAALFRPYQVLINGQQQEWFPYKDVEYCEPRIGRISDDIGYMGEYIKMSVLLDDLLENKDDQEKTKEKIMQLLLYRSKAYRKAWIDLVMRSEDKQQVTRLLELALPIFVLHKDIKNFNRAMRVFGNLVSAKLAQELLDLLLEISLGDLHEEFKASIAAMVGREQVPDHWLWRMVVWFSRLLGVPYEFVVSMTKLLGTRLEENESILKWVDSMSDYFGEKWILGVFIGFPLGVLALVILSPPLYIINLWRIVGARLSPWQFFLFTIVNHVSWLVRFIFFPLRAWVRWHLRAWGMRLPSESLFPSWPWSRNKFPKWSFDPLIDTEETVVESDAVRRARQGYEKVVKDFNELLAMGSKPRMLCTLQELKRRIEAMRSADDDLIKVVIDVFLNCLSKYITYLKVTDLDVLEELKELVDMSVGLDLSKIDTLMDLDPWARYLWVRAALLISKQIGSGTGKNGSSSLVDHYTDALYFNYHIGSPRPLSIRQRDKQVFIADVGLLKGSSQCDWNVAYLPMIHSEDAAIRGIAQGFANRMGTVSRLERGARIDMILAFLAKNMGYRFVSMAGTRFKTVASLFGDVDILEEVDLNTRKETRIARGLISRYLVEDPHALADESVIINIADLHQMRPDVRSALFQLLEDGYYDMETDSGNKKRLYLPENVKLHFTLPAGNDYNFESALLSRVELVFVPALRYDPEVPQEHMRTRKSRTELEKVIMGVHGLKKNEVRLIRDSLALMYLYDGGHYLDKERDKSRWKEDHHYDFHASDGIEMAAWAQLAIEQREKQQGRALDRAERRDLVLLEIYRYVMMRLRPEDHDLAQELFYTTFGFIAPALDPVVIDPVTGLITEIMGVAVQPVSDRAMPPGLIDPDYRLTLVPSLAWRASALLRALSPRQDQLGNTYPGRTVINIGNSSMGKTTLGGFIGKILGLDEYYVFSVDGQTEEDDLTWQYVANSRCGQIDHTALTIQGRFAKEIQPFLAMWEMPNKNIMIDEIDLKGELLAFFSEVARGVEYIYLDMPGEKTQLYKRGKNTIVQLSMNELGEHFQGREELDKNLQASFVLVRYPDRYSRKEACLIHYGMGGLDVSPEQLAAARNAKHGVHKAKGMGRLGPGSSPGGHQTFLALGGDKDGKNGSAQMATSGNLSGADGDMTTSLHDGTAVCHPHPTSPLKGEAISDEVLSEVNTSPPLRGGDQGEGDNRECQIAKCKIQNEQQRKNSEAFFFYNSPPWRGGVRGG